MQQQQQKQINFQPLIHTGFWIQLSKFKIEEWKLDQSEQQILAKYKNSSFKDKKSKLVFDSYSFDKESCLSQTGPLEVQVNVKLINFNTIEEFNNFNISKYAQEKLKYTDKHFSEFLENNTQDQELQVLQPCLITFGDLKKYEFHYKLVCPGFTLDNLNIAQKIELPKYEQLQIKLFEEKLRQFIDNEKDFSPIFGFDNKEGQILPLKNILEKYEHGTHQFCIFDPYNFDDGVNFLVHNFLYLLKKHNKFQKITLITLKDNLLHQNPNPHNFKFSQVFEYDLSETKVQYQKEQQQNFEFHGEKDAGIVKTVNLKSQMDEMSLARDAINLNVKLMKWRMLPNLDFEDLKKTKVLLIGAGTLGCQLSRNLIGWGIQNITFVDYGNVSYSNPVRQSLYDYEDSINGGKPKAECAAAKLKKIYPDIQSEGYNLRIPMPGHFLVNKQQEEETLKSVDFLEKLVESHDAVYLLTDTRESRWLPTVLANRYNKICITVGLGFDSYVIVRHGMNSENFEQQKQKDPENKSLQRLSCYFCNDVAVPGNTMKDRTLDQQCTVTRPGLSFVSAAYASELLVSLLSHPLKNECPAHEDKNKLEQTDLGILPQHIRGCMSEFETQIFYGSAFTNCIACSNFVLQEYKNNRDEFLLRVINDSDFLHQIAEIDIGELEEGQIIEIDDDDDDF